MDSGKHGTRFSSYLKIKALAARLHSNAIRSLYMSSFENIKHKLRKFRRKYYTNMLIRGSILSLSILILLFLLPAVLEYYGYFDTLIRTIFFFSMLIGGMLVLGFYVFRPIMKILNLGKTIDDNAAARMIGQHFPDIRDKLLNTLQLRDLGQQPGRSLQLIEASIEQRTKEMKAFSFQQAVSFGVNRKYLRLLLPLSLLFLFILIASPDLITEPSKRIVQYNVHFEKPAPFEISIMNDTLTAIEGDNFELKVKTSGEVLPEKLYLSSGGNRMRLQKESPDHFSYLFSNLNRDVYFSIQAEDYKTGDFLLKVHPKPVLISFDILLSYPEYTRKENELLENNGEVIIPEGTDVKWKFYTKQVEELLFALNGESSILQNEKSNVFEYRKKIFDNSRYFFQPRNKYSQREDTLFYAINVMKDAYPDIIVNEEQDSSMRGRTFFTGVIKDDYGFSSLKFYYSINEEDEKEILLSQLIDPLTEEQRFYYSSDFSQIDLKPGDEMVYYFEIWDNDAVNGYKPSRSRTFSYRMPTKEEISEKIREEKDKIEQGVEEKLIELNMLNQEIDELSRQMLEKEKMEWQDMKRVEDLLKRQNKLQNDVQQLVNENRKANKRLQEEDLLKNQEILEKQQRIQELMEQLLDEETKEMLRKLQEMLEKMDKDQVMEMMENIKMSNEEMEESLDRNLELFKQLDYEKLLNEITQKLEQMAKEQKKLSDQTADKKADKDKSMQEQEELKKEFEEVKKDIEELKKKNEELENKNKEFDSQELEQEIQQDMENSMENMQQNKMGKASESQENASSKMKKMAEQMMEVFNSSVQQSTGEDMHAVREILENLIETSYDQEELIHRINNIHPGDPGYVEIMQEQNNIKDNMGVVEDSLRALAKRQMAIQPFVTKELSKITNNLRKVNENLKERRTSMVSRDQQYIMTAVNNLALLLAEALQQMQNSMNQQNSNSSKGSCSKPGGKGSTAKSMKQLQQKLNESMQQMQQGMEGKGEQGKKGKRSLSEQFARMAAEQASIRERLQEYLEQLEEQGVKAGGMAEMMEEMEKTEEELVNKILTNETMQRQKDILTRLLKSEKAEMEREKKKERESEEAKNVKRSNPENFLEYNRMKTGEAELLKKVNPKLKRFYQKRVNEYFYNSGVITKENHNGSNSN
ncbi:MAG: DUF4175 family protein [Bacteroidota bacterium]|nr:DUF4175 family protein [Bacteroidota bacterium]